MQQSRRRQGLVPPTRPSPPPPQVDVYGDRMPLKACGSVSVRDPQLLAVTVFDSDVS